MEWGESVSRVEIDAGIMRVRWRGRRTSDMREVSGIWEKLDEKDGVFG